MADARAIHAIEIDVQPPAERFKRVRGDLLGVWERELDQERLDVDALEAHWSELTERSFAGAEKFDDLYDRIDRSRDPAALAVTLLRPLDSEHDERSHTRMLGSLLDPSACGRLGIKLLDALLRVPELGVSQGFSENLLRQAEVRIEPSWSFGPKPTIVRPDLVITIPMPAAPLVVVIENKINARDHEGQLDTYREYAEEVFADAEVVLVYLTPRGDDPVAAEQDEPWRRLAYWTIAVAWRRVLARETEASAWTEMLRFYLASILQGVFRDRLEEPLSRAAKARLVPYLEAALGE